ncbi:MULTISPECIES: GGDEF domain-containing protein [Bacteria]|uniref:GGDEF domain-containing protein n=1 Tax=Bacteria TaxID=2 RepID=UPI00197D7FC6
MGATRRAAFHAGRERFRCTFSVGISSFPEHPSTESLRLSADQALYRAKHQGRNQVVLISTAQDHGGFAPRGA